MKKYIKSIGLALGLLVIVPATQAAADGGFDSVALAMFPGQAMTAVNELPKKINELKGSLKKLQMQAKSMAQVKNTKVAVTAVSDSMHTIYQILNNDIDKILELIIPTLISACKILGDPMLNNVSASNYMTMLNNQYDDLLKVVKQTDELLLRVKQTVIDKPNILPEKPIEAVPFEE